MSNPQSGDPLELCDARIRPMRHANETDVECGLPADDHRRHAGVLRDYAYPGSATTVQWMEDDRRTFHGDWPGACIELGVDEPCVLPADHRGGHQR